MPLWNAVTAGKRDPVPRTSTVASQLYVPSVSVRTSAREPRVRSRSYTVFPVRTESTSVTAAPLSPASPVFAFWLVDRKMPRGCIAFSGSIQRAARHIERKNGLCTGRPATLRGFSLTRSYDFAADAHPSKSLTVAQFGPPSRPVPATRASSAPPVLRNLAGIPSRGTFNLRLQGESDCPAYVPIPM